MKSLKQSSLIFCFILAFSNYLSSQTTEELVKELQVKLEAANELLKNNDVPNAQIALTDIKNEMVKFEAYKESAKYGVTQKYESQIAHLKTQMGALNQTISDLEDKLKTANAAGKSDALQVVERILREAREQDTKFEELKTENNDLKKEIKTLGDTVTNLKVRFTEVKSDRDKYVFQYDEKRNEVNKYKSAVKIGLSVGFNSYWNNQKDYIVQKDSTVKQIGSGDGASGIISSVISIRLSSPEKPIQHNVVINIPLGDFTSNSDRAIGLFNNRIAVGLGYSMAPFKDVPYLSFTGILNMSPFEKLDFETLKSEKVLLPKYTKLKPQDFGSTTDISYSFTIGIVYSFINVGGKKE